MVERELTYVDYDGTKRTETFRFNLSKAELAEWELSVNGGLEKKLKNIIEKVNGPEIISTFKELIMKSYGEKSADGRTFEKSEELTKSFMQTEAYSDLFMELITNPDKAAEFVNGVISKIE